MPRIGAYDFPDDLRYDAHCEIWLRPRPDGTLTLGITALSCDFAGEFAVFTPRPDGREYDAGRAVAMLETCKTVGAVKTPVAVRILAANDAVLRRPNLVNADPYEAGWLLHVQPLNWLAEAPRLLDFAQAARAHEAALARMRALREDD